MAWIFTAEGWAAFLTLTVLEIVLGIDNIIFISILAGKLPSEKQGKASGDFGSDSQRSAEQHAGQDIGGRPQYGRQDIDQKKAIDGHIQHACDRWNQRPDRPNEARHDNAFTAVSMKKIDTLVNHFRIPPKWPHNTQALMIKTSDQVAGAVTDHRAHRGPHQGWQ